MQRIDLKSELDNEWMTQRSVVEMRVGQPNAQNQLDDDDDLKSEWSHLDDKSQTFSFAFSLCVSVIRNRRGPP